MSNDSYVNSKITINNYIKINKNRKKYTDF